VLAHPPRTALFALLRSEGPSTASRSGQRLGGSSGGTGHHLRQLAALGFVEEVPGGTARERWWQARHRSARRRTEDGVEQPGGEVVEGFTHLPLSTQRRLLAAHAEQREDLAPEWRDATSPDDWALHLSPAAARELAAELDGVLQRWRAEREDPAQPLVSVLVDVFLLSEHPS
jgi:hypothetical protein